MLGNRGRCQFHPLDIACEIALHLTPLTCWMRVTHFVSVHTSYVNRKCRGYNRLSMVLCHHISQGLWANWKIGFFSFSNLKIFSRTIVFAYTYLCARCVPGSEESTRSPRIDSGKSPCECCELNPDPLEERCAYQLSHLSSLFLRSQ